MFAWLKAQVISFLSIPPEPEAPAGSQSSLLVFRASPAYQRYRMALWWLGRLAMSINSAEVPRNSTGSPLAWGSTSVRRRP